MDFDVVLITADRTLATRAARACPPAARLQHLSPQELEAEARIDAQELWLDLDTLAAMPDEAVRRRVYFYSRKEAIPEGLPPGLFIRKPCAPTVFQVLWANVRPPGSAGIGGRASADAGASLPAWILDYHDLTLASLCRKLTRGLGPRLGFRHASLYLHDPGRGLLTLAESTHERAIEFSLPMDAPGQHLMVAVARGGRVFQTDHAGAERQVRGLPTPEHGYDDEACLIAPLCSDGQVWGVLNLSGRERTPLTEEGLFLDTLFAFLGRALHHARAHEQARIEARIDSLTGLYNQRWMSESLAREIRRAERFGTTLAILMVDLDGLKRVNDGFGHAAGDCVLRHVATRITRILRQFDGAARVGGDEFIVMLPGTALAGARGVARRLLDSVRRDPAHFRDVALPITASVGAAEWQAGWGPEQLCEAADRAMYAAKQSGRDSVASVPIAGPPA